MWETLSKYRSFIILMGILLITVGTCKTITRNRDWYNRECLLHAGLRVLPHNAKMHYNFANFLKDSFRRDLAAIHYREALRLWPTYASAHNNLGTMVGDPEDEDHFLSAIKYASTHVNAHFNLGQVYLQRNRTEDAIQMMKRCIELDATYVKAHLELLKIHGRGSRAARVLTDAIKANPGNLKLRLSYGDWLLNNGLAPAALHTYHKVFERDISNQFAITGICKSMRKLGQRSRLDMLITRLRSIHRLANGGSYRIDLYLRSWYLRREIELKRRAYLYNIDNEASYEQLTTNGHSEGTRNNTRNTMIMPHQLNYTNDDGGVQRSRNDEIKQNSSNESENNGRNDERNTSNLKDSTYQKQYRNDAKPTTTTIMTTAIKSSTTTSIQSNDVTRHNGIVNIEINTTARKPISANNFMSESDPTIKYLCGKNELIVDHHHHHHHHHCGSTWNKSVCNCSDKKALQDAKTTSTRTGVSDVVQKNKRIQCPFNPQATCEIGKSKKSPKLKTQNTFISRLFLTDILDNI